MSQRLMRPILAGLTFPKSHAQEVGGIGASLRALLLPKAFSESKLAGHLLLWLHVNRDSEVEMVEVGAYMLAACLELYID